ncbi:CIR protein PIR protein [Plasmodium vinckei brucechwatti]|uniref:CIR protein PIR protein n=1 Tax=Plasmodium vinckei brucechwatti TaxID=119398 RepID=A0A6V7S5G7_PLAVN|nr:CIR protein PIR protein [Plasmodium vinckei brucechwatti]
MSKEVCKIFLKVDSAFKNGRPDLDKIYNTIEYRKYCPKNAEGVTKCEDDIQGINSLYLHIFTELFKQSQEKLKRENNDSQYVEYVMMWLGFRLFHSQSYSSTNFMDFYNNYTKKTHLLYTFEHDILKKEHLLNANLYHMSRFYWVFNKICFMTLKYSANNINASQMKKDYDILNKNYKSLYDDIGECNSYLNLLNNLETIYKNLKKSLFHGKQTRRILLRGAQYVNLEDLPPTKKADKKSTIGFNCPKCKQINSKAEEKKPKPASKPLQPVKPKQSASSPSELPLPPQKQQVSQQTQQPAVPTPPAKPESGKPKTDASQQAEKQPPTTPQAEQKSVSETSSTPTTEQLPLSPSAEQEPPSSPQVLSPDSPSPAQPPALTTTIQKGQPDSQGVLNVPGGQLPNQENPPKSSDNGQDNSASQTKEQGGDIVDKPKEPQDGQQQNPVSKQETSNGVPENADNNLGNQSVGKGGSDVEPQNPTTQQNDQNITQGNSLTQHEDSGSMQLQNIFNIFKGTFETFRSPFYNTYTDIGNKLYEKATSTLENAYDKSRKFASSTINYVNEQLNKALENGHPSKEKKPESAPSLPDGKQAEPQNIPTPGQADQSHDNSQMPSPTQNIDSSNSKQVNPPNPPPEKKPQLPVDHSNKAPNTKIKSEDPGTIVKENTPQLIKDKDIFKGYNRPEIAITVLLISIILLIMYKYLSYGWRKELKRKKSMKKVINSIEGRIPVQIIISASYKKKQTKKYINSTYGEKFSPLNIYKLMQADPVPFINLFFLLIFFVYKRKYDSLEL